jgi:hypothetical protein
VDKKLNYTTYYFDRQTSNEVTEVHFKKKEVQTNK